MGVKGIRKFSREREGEGKESHIWDLQKFDFLGGGEQG